MVRMELEYINLTLEQHQSYSEIETAMNEFQVLKFPFISLIDFIRSKLSF